jgi:hypothetical protein
MIHKEMKILGYHIKIKRRCIGIYSFLRFIIHNFEYEIIIEKAL